MATTKLTDSGKQLSTAHKFVDAATVAFSNATLEVQRAVKRQENAAADLKSAEKLLTGIMSGSTATTAPAPTSPANEYVVYLRDHRDINVTADVASHELVGNRTMLVFTNEGETAHVAEFDLASVVGLHRSPITEK